jgi:two-component system cell cycle response regulator
MPSMLESAAHRGKAMSMMVLDIDHFKKVNDTYGHDAGDEVLKEFASRVRKTLRMADLVCRMGGEEFVVVMPETPLAIAHKVAERVRKVIEGAMFPINAGARAIPITVSIGLSDRGADMASDAMFKRADRALYKSKNNGRNQVTAEAA